MKKTKSKFLLLCLALIPFFLPAQMPFQQLSAYNPNTILETGQFNDVECLDYVGPANANVVAIGINSNPTTEGLFGVLDANGNIVYYMEFQNGGDPVIAEAIAELPNTEIVLTFFDPVANATDIVVLEIDGTPVWEHRLPDFHVRDVHAGSAPYLGGQGIWLTGEKTGPGGHVVVQAFNGDGILQFAQVHTVLGHDSSVGNAVHFDDNTNHIVIVGKAEITGFPGSSMFCFRLFSNGFWAVGRRYQDPSGIERYNAKALIPNPSLNSHYGISYDYEPANSPFDQIGIMNVDASLTPTWSQTFQGVNFFSGKNYRTTGIEAVGNSFIACGSFNSKVNPIQSSAFALTISLQGASPKMNEYELNSYYPSKGCAIQGISLNQGNNMPYMVGHFQTLPGGNNWPSGNNPRSYWMMATTAFAEGYCSTSGQTLPMPSNANSPFDFYFWAPMPAPTTSPLTHSLQDPIETLQCFFAKRASESGVDSEVKGEVQSYFLVGQQQIIVEIPSEEKGPGQIEILDLQGRVLIATPAQAGKQAIDTHTLSKGIYLVRTKVPGLPLTVKKLMVQ